MRTLSAAMTFLTAAFLAAPAMAQDKPNLSGSWQFDSSKSELHNFKVTSATWLIDEGDNSIHITETEDGKSKKTELKCTTDGKDCQESGGEKAKASFWYNGPMLVEMETKGDHVMRYRLKMGDDGKSLRVEVTSIVPKVDESDVLMFSKL